MTDMVSTTGNTTMDRNTKNRPMLLPAPVSQIKIFSKYTRYAQILLLFSVYHKYPVICRVSYIKNSFMEGELL